MAKLRMYAIGIITLAMAPLGWVIAGFPDLDTFLSLNKLFNIWTILGLCLGYVYGLIMFALGGLMEIPKRFERQFELIKSLNLTTMDCLFLSICAGFGEEFLFRAGLQTWIHPIITAILFVAIHGYLDPREKKVLILGNVLLVFIVLLSYSISYQGIWFCIAAHFSYDAVLFLKLRDRVSSK